MARRTEGAEGGASSASAQRATAASSPRRKRTRARTRTDDNSYFSNSFTLQRSLYGLGALILSLSYAFIVGFRELELRPARTILESSFIQDAPTCCICEPEPSETDWESTFVTCCGQPGASDSLKTFPTWEVIAAVVTVIIIIIAVIVTIVCLKKMPGAEHTVQQSAEDELDELDEANIQLMRALKKIIRCANN